jgi:hypothetical protein
MNTSISQQKCVAVPRRARSAGSYTSTSLNSYHNPQNQGTLSAEINANLNDSEATRTIERFFETLNQKRLPREKNLTTSPTTQDTPSAEINAHLNNFEARSAIERFF